MTARHRKPPSSRAKVAVSVVMVLLAAFALTLTSVPGADGAFLASITNDTTTAATDPYFTCAGAAADQTVLKPYLVYPLSNPVAGGSAADLTAAGRTGTYSTIGEASASDGTVCPRDTQTSLTKFTGTGTTNVLGLTPGGATSSPPRSPRQARVRTHSASPRGSRPRRPAA